MPLTACVVRVPDNSGGFSVGRHAEHSLRWSRPSIVDIGFQRMYYKGIGDFPVSVLRNALRNSSAVPGTNFSAGIEYVERYIRFLGHSRTGSGPICMFRTHFVGQYQWKHHRTGREHAPRPGSRCFLLQSKYYLGSSWRTDNRHLLRRIRCREGMSCIETPLTASCFEKTRVFYSPFVSFESLHSRSSLHVPLPKTSLVRARRELTILQISQTCGIFVVGGDSTSRPGVNVSDRMQKNTKRCLAPAKRNTYGVTLTITTRLKRL